MGGLLQRMGRIDMNLKFISLLLLTTVLMLMLVGCGGNSQPTQGLSTPKISSVDATLGDRVEVAIELHQKYGYVSGIPCAEDGVFLANTFGNMTELAFKEKEGARSLDDKLGIVTTFSYGIAFYPPADGEYKVYVGDKSCSVREQGLSATVHWDIYRQ